MQGKTPNATQCQEKNTHKGEKEQPGLPLKVFPLVREENLLFPGHWAKY